MENSITPAEGTTTTDDEFLALVLADPDLLEAEFAEITAEARLCPPPPVGPCTVGIFAQPGRRPTTAHIARAGGIQPVTRPRGPAAEAWNRQRSPPTLPDPRPNTIKQSW